MDELLNTTGKRLSAVMRAQRVQVRELAASVGVSAPHITNIKYDQTGASAELIGDIARVLGVSADFLLCLSDELNNGEKVPA
jgi:transcriptional regulator with XRE-family HTH domain